MKMGVDNRDRWEVLDRDPDPDPDPENPDPETSGSGSGRDPDPDPGPDPDPEIRDFGIGILGSIPHMGPASYFYPHVQKINYWALKLKKLRK